MSVVIPDDILQSSKMTEDELKLEIALSKEQQLSCILGDGVAQYPLTKKTGRN